MIAAMTRQADNQGAAVIGRAATRKAPSMATKATNQTARSCIGDLIFSGLILVSVIGQRTGHP